MMIEPTITSPSIHVAAMPKPSPVDRPRLMNIERARHELGEIGRTRFYEVARERGIRLLKFDSHTVIAAEDIDRVVAEVLAGGEGQSNVEQAKAAGAASVAVRRSRRRGGAPP